MIINILVLVKSLNIDYRMQITKTMRYLAKKTIFSQNTGLITEYFLWLRESNISLALLFHGYRLYTRATCKWCRAECPCGFN